MVQVHGRDVTDGSLKLWLERAGRNGSKCVICLRIAEKNAPAAAELKPIRISGIEVTPEVQISHLVRCVGNDEPGR